MLGAHWSAPKNLPRRPLFPFILDSPLNPTITGSIQVSTISLLCFWVWREREIERVQHAIAMYMSLLCQLCIFMYTKTDRQTERERGSQEGREGERGRVWTLPSIPHHPYIVVTDLRRPDGVIALKKETTIYTHVKRVPEHTPKKNQVQVCAQIQQLWYIFVCMRAYTGMCLRVAASKVEWIYERPGY